MTRRIGPSCLSSRSLTAVSMASVTLAAILLVGACYTRAAERQMPAEVTELPALEDIVHAFEELLRPLD